MELIKKFFGHAFVNTEEVKNLVIKIVIYVVVGAVCGILVGLIGYLPFGGPIAYLLDSLVGLYFTASIVFAILSHFKVLK